MAESPPTSPRTPLSHPAFKPAQPPRLQDCTSAWHPPGRTRVQQLQQHCPQSRLQNRTWEPLRNLTSEGGNAHLISCRSFIHSSNTCFDSAS